MRLLLLLILSALLAACGGGGDGTADPAPPPATVQVGGTLAGLGAGKSVVIADAGGPSASLAANGVYSLSLPAGTPYSLSILTQPTGQSCVIANGSGIASSTIDNITVTCADNPGAAEAKAVSGSVSGLGAGKTLVLQLAGEDLTQEATVTADGSFQFPQPVVGGYTLTVKTAPAGQACTVGVTTPITVTCAVVASSFRLGGTVTGNIGAVALRNTGNGDTLVLTSNGGFTFAQALAQGAAYNVAVFDQSPSQSCAVANGSGNAGADVDSVRVHCTALVTVAPPAPPPPPPPTYTVGGTVTGLLSGYSVTLLNNGTDSRVVSADGTFTFATSLLNAAAYSVTVAASPRHDCVVAGGTGAIAAAPATTVNVACRPRAFVYVANNAALGGAAHPDVTGFTLNVTTGMLSLVTTGTFAAGSQPVAVAAHPSGRFLYVARQAGSDISGYGVSTTGVLTPLAGSPFTAGGVGPRAIAIDPSGKFLLTTIYSAQGVAVHSINTVTGVLTPVAGSPFATGGLGPHSVTVDPTGRYVYVANQSGNNVAAYRLDGTTGALTMVPGSPFAVATQLMHVTTDPSGRFLYVTSGNTNTVHAYTINGADGSLLPVVGSPFASSGSPWGVTADPGGQYLFVTNIGANSLSAYLIGSTTGDLTSVAGSPFAAGDQPISLAFDPTRRFAVLANFFSQTLSVYAFDAATGAVAPVAGSPFGGVTFPYGVAVTMGP